MKNVFIALLVISIMLIVISGTSEDHIAILLTSLFAGVGFVTGLLGVIYTPEIQDTKIRKLRRSGNSTRIIDDAIQHYFDTGAVIFEDHNPDDSKRIMNIAIRRLNFEHGLVKHRNFTVRGTTIKKCFMNEILYKKTIKEY